jgi:Holliday junction resolvase
MSKPKAQGTRHESWVVQELQALGIQARRLAEGGAADEGDVEATINGTRWVLEGKATQSLNVQKILGKARRKAGGNTPVAVVWKRLVKVAGLTNRQPVEGERTVVILSWEDFTNLLKAKEPSNDR